MAVRAVGVVLGAALIIASILCLAVVGFVDGEGETGAKIWLGYVMAGLGTAVGLGVLHLTFVKGHSRTFVLGFAALTVALLVVMAAYSQTGAFD